MSEANNVIVVKVHRNKVGAQLAFDKLYFFDREDRELIPKIFGHAIVMPSDDGILKAIEGLTAKKVSHLKWHRDDESLNKLTGVDGRSMTTAEVEDWWKTEIFDKYDLANRVTVIPVLTSKVKNKLRPRYMASKKWFKAKSSRYKAPEVRLAISELSYLATPHAPPNDKIRPLCAMCPRIMQHLQGECLPGQEICYKSLNLFDVVETQSEAKEQQNVSVQSDDSRDNRHPQI